MLKMMKAVTSVAFAAGLAATPLAAVAQEQPARSTGNTDNAQDQRTNEQVRRTPSMGGGASQEPTGPSGTSMNSNDAGGGVHPVPQAPAGAGSAATSGSSGSKPVPGTDTRN
ncbi:hypothetical protein [Hansschlegelia beijingensis]|uniref:Proteophosphoglycan ppg4 n=1 Tax=Hansschlegelia beijingensis TaxID=1133344 RepID=A0A7W6GER5_9HYPH|nr:hypothetical protein [Hansschlegelia beijingensis]MBB3972500.1 hypothetical protein [Hansschlegelia beijingensis]